MSTLSKVGWLAAASVVLACATHVPASAQPADPAPIRIEETAYPTADGPEPMTVYRPAEARTDMPSTGLVFVHVGAWIGGKRQLLDSEAREAASRGFVVFDIDYDLAAPRDPRQYRDVEAAIAYVRDHAGELGVGPDRLGGLGTSAGAHLLMQAVVTDGAPLAAVVGWSGPYDLTVRATPEDAMLSTMAAVAFLQCVPLVPDCADRAASASPALHTSGSNPPVLLFNSSDELMPLDQMTTFADRLRGNGVPVRTQMLPGKRHAVAYGDHAIGPTLDFLDRQLRSS
ncbi:alpha/beta hydrolase [Nocardia sp. NPDC059091]|uniref:alpha/beta hydrolase n=1 Tax=unclassified Nocardia TaxID=2637762 RepID=UPI0036BC7C14